MSNQLTKPTTKISVSDLPGEMAPELRAVFDQMVKDCEWSGSCFSMPRLPSKDERKLLMAYGCELAPAVRAISEDGSARQLAGACIAEMFQGWPNFKPNAKDETIGHYVTVMVGLPLFAIQAACADVAQGLVPDLSPHFPPSAPFMCQLARKKSEAKVTEMALLKRVLSTKMLRVEKNVDPDERARVAEKMKALAGEFDKQQREKDDAASRELAARTIARNSANLLAEYRASGINPVYFGKVPVSLSLIRSNHHYMENKAQHVSKTYEGEGS